MRYFLICVLFPLSLNAQQLIDPCFQSIELGMFSRSDYIRNLCLCVEQDISSDLLEWDESSQTWLGAIINSKINIIPPTGCNTRAIWMGANNWTWGGEAFAMKLDKPFEPGMVYTYTFTYASTGIYSTGNFAPILSTDHDEPTIRWSYPVTTLPPANGWRTETISFTATTQQAGHNWLVLHTVDCSGIILSNCSIEKPIAEIKSVEENGKDYYCLGQTISLNAKSNNNYTYQWNTGETTASILVTSPGNYSLKVMYGNCSSEDEAFVDFKDCEARLEMPNIFTPNDDNYNSTFSPLAYNYISNGTVIIYNRWGDKIFVGDLFDGWDGTYNGDEMSTGVYFYEVYYQTEDNLRDKVRGIVTLAR